MTAAAGITATNFAENTTNSKSSAQAGGATSVVHTNLPSVPVIWTRKLANDTTHASGPSHTTDPSRNAGPQAFGPQIRTILFELLGFLLSIATLVVAILHYRTKRRIGPDLEASVNEERELDNVQDAVPSAPEDGDRVSLPESMTPHTDI